MYFPLLSRCCSAAVNSSMYPLSVQVSSVSSGLAEVIWMKILSFRPISLKASSLSTLDLGSNLATSSSYRSLDPKKTKIKVLIPSTRYSNTLWLLKYR